MFRKRDKKPSKLGELEYELDDATSLLSQLETDCAMNDFEQFAYDKIKLLCVINNLKEYDLKELRVNVTYKYRIKLLENTYMVLERICRNIFEARKTVVQGFIEAAQKLYKYMSRMPSHMNDFTKSLDNIQLYNDYGHSLIGQWPFFTIMQSDIIWCTSIGYNHVKTMDIVFEHYGVDPYNWEWPEDF